MRTARRERAEARRMRKSPYAKRDFVVLNINRALAQEIQFWARTNMQSREDWIRDVLMATCAGMNESQRFQLSPAAAVLLDEGSHGDESRAS